MTLNTRLPEPSTLGDATTKGYLHQFLRVLKQIFTNLDRDINLNKEAIELMVKSYQVTEVDKNANFSVIVPANGFLTKIIIEETAGNSVTGGIEVGTTDGGDDVVGNITVGVNTTAVTADSDILTKFFGDSEQEIFFNAVTDWNGATVTLKLVYEIIKN